MLSCMSAFDFFFPEQAQASHLRTLVRQRQFEFQNDQREKQDAREELKHAQTVIQKMGEEMAETRLLIKAMMEVMDETDICDSSQLLEKVREIDLRDGLADGKITSTRDRPKPKFETNRNWKDS